MATTSPTRIDDDLFEAARLAGARHSRSASQQITHWAKLGRALESMPGLEVSAVEQVLAGAIDYDELNAEGQGVVRAAWVDLIHERRMSLDFESEFAAHGDAYVEAAPDGSVIHHGVATPR